MSSSFLKKALFEKSISTAMDVENMEINQRCRTLNKLKDLISEKNQTNLELDAHTKLEQWRVRELEVSKPIAEKESSYRDVSSNKRWGQDGH